MEMNRDDKVLAFHPPHPEEGASTCAPEKTRSLRSARLEGWAAPWFETPRTRLRNLGRPKIAAPHHEAERGRECIKLIGIRFSGIAASFRGNRRQQVACHRAPRF